VEFDCWHHLLEDLLDISGKFLRVSRRNAHVLHLGGLGVALDVLHLLFLIASEQIRRDLVQQIPEEAGIIVAVSLKSTLELLDLVLGELVGDWNTELVWLFEFDDSRI
jgi:hypothetical protein